MPKKKKNIIAKKTINKKKKILAKTKKVVKTKNKIKVRKKTKDRNIKIAKNKIPQTLRGFKDILPSEQKYWDLVRNKVREIARDYGFERIDTPIIEETALFSRSVGKQTDIVEKEMFSFTDRGGDDISLRPEATASIARAYTQHGMVSLPQPVKLYYIGPMFRYDRPQSGRYRQFHQFGFEVLGEDNPVIDAYLILIVFNFLKEIGIESNVQINSIGCQECRRDYQNNLVRYYRSKRSYLCADCKRRLVKNPLRLLDCKEEKCRTVRNEAPQIVDWLCDDCKKHFVKVLEYLDELEVPYILNPWLVRGLDYYTRTVFEFWANDDESSGRSALGGGGRYDKLIEELGGQPTPASGFSIGIERVILKIKELGIEIKKKDKPQVFLAQIGEQAKSKALVLFEDLRRKGIPVAERFSKNSLKAQLEIANKLSVKLVLILGQKEVADGTILLRDMEGGIQEIIDFKKIIPILEKKLGIKLEKSK